MIKSLTSLLIKFTILCLLLILPFIISIGVSEFYVYPYYIKTNISLLLSLSIILGFSVYYLAKIYLAFSYKKISTKCQNIEKMFIAEITNNKILINRLSKLDDDYGDIAIYIKCRNFVMLNDYHSALLLSTKCNDLEMKKAILSNMLYYYHNIGDGDKINEIIETINSIFHRPYWSFVIQIDYFYKKNQIDKVIEILKKNNSQTLSTEYDLKDFNNHCTLLIAQKHIDDKNFKDAIKQIKSVTLRPDSPINITLSKMFIAVENKNEAVRIMNNLSKFFISMDLIDLFISSDYNITTTPHNDQQISSYLSALDKYKSGALKEALNNLASNSNNYEIYKLRANILLKLGSTNDAARYLEKLDSSKKIWHWECSKCHNIVKDYSYECNTCKSFGTLKLIND